MIGNSSSPSLSLNKPKLDNLANEVWKSAERLRGKFKAYEYQNVILPIIVIRRLECVLLKWRTEKKAEIRARQPQRTDEELDALVKKLELNPAQAPFSNKTDWTLHKIYEEDHTLLEDNFRAYVNGFSENVQDTIEHFNYRATIGLMVKNNRLAPILNQYKELALGPDQLSNLEMGYIYEELLRRFSEQSGEEAGYTDENVKLFCTTDFAYHKVSAVFWQTDEHDQPAIVTESYEKAFTAANIVKEQEFYASELHFTVRLTEPESRHTETVAFTLTPKDSLPQVFEEAVREVFATAIEAQTEKLSTADKKKTMKRFLDSLRAEVEWTHRHYGLYYRIS